ncbi:MAG TPA: excinuclease ABC subunit UvrA [Symbiobacteriaceae bacterium]|nr:excinuclease ABC subunit UvrA [Symbiobacteriaceae bacterium]
MIRQIEVRGARENNLKNISLEIPKDALTVVTGVSGSGKSSLVFDVIFSEGQRRFLESLDTYARRFTSQLKKPDVDFVFGLSPVLAIQQKKGIRNPRSTVGSMTDIADYLRLLYASLGEATCPYCSRSFGPKTTNQMVEHILALPKGTAVEIYAPVEKVYGEPYSYLFDQVRKKGYRKFRVDGKLVDTSQKHELDEDVPHTLEVFIDKFMVASTISRQLTDSLEQAFLVGDRFLRIEIAGPDVTDEIRAHFYSGFGCPEHHMVVGELLPFYFTANDSESACETCRGIGTYLKAMPHLMVDHWHKSVRQGALTNTWMSVKHPYKYMLLYSLAQHYGFSLDVPLEEMPQEAQDVLFYGTKGQRFTLVQPPDVKKRLPEAGRSISYEGLIPQLDTLYKRAARKGTAESAYHFVFKRHMAEQPCPDCGGTKLRRSRLLVRLGGQNIHQLGEMPADELLAFMRNLPLPAGKEKIGEQIVAEITGRLQLLVDVGLNYISLGRRGDSVSGGEAQRIRLSTQISSGLSGMLYVLDEPSIGLHPRDSDRIIGTMNRLRDAGNTVLVVEHDRDTILAADHVVEIGPGPGEHGGTVVAQGSVAEVMADPQSLTGDYLTGRRQIPVPQRRRAGNGQFLTIRGARHHNLKNVDVQIPLGMLVCVTGVSGSGKSSLINGTLHKKLQALRHDPRVIPGAHDALLGHEQLTGVINVDQSPIGRSSRSNPATYVGFFDRIRHLFAETDLARARGYEVSHFTSGHKHGRCDECAGNGVLVTELQFMPDVETVCPVCKGTGFQRDILDVTYHDKNIAEVLELSVEAASSFFADQRYIQHKLKVMADLGLGYVRLGQWSSTLSGGEAQRIKLATELGKIHKGAHNLYILDEPTTGLHWADIQRLLDCMNRLVDAGHTVLVIEHHLDVIKNADYVIDVGPGAGKQGGYIVAAGTPEDVARAPGSYTGQFLREVLTA